MTIQLFKPELWSKILLQAEQKALVFGSPMVVNRDYEGEIKGPGDTVHITAIADPVISDYAPNQGITYQTVEDEGQVLTISQKKYFAFEIDDVDELQANGEMQPYLEDRASYRLAEKADEWLASFYTGVNAGNVVGGTTVTTSSLASGNYLTPLLYSSTHPADFYTQVLIPLKMRLDLANVPQAGRYCIVPTWAEALLAQTQAFVAFPGTDGGAGAVMSEGFIGRAAGFNILQSNNCVQYDGTNHAYAIQAGHPMAMSFAEQILKTEALRLQNTFADSVRGLHVYGGKLVKPEAIAVAGVQNPYGF